MKTFQYTIQDEMGIHARPAGMLVKEAKAFSSKVSLEAGGKTVAAGIVAVEHIEYNCFIGIFFLKVALHHCQLVEVCEQCQILLAHSVFLLNSALGSGR